MTFKDYVEKYIALTDEAGNLEPDASDTEIAANDQDKVLLFSPHPDDEAITGGLPLRLKQENKFDVVNVPVTYGSDITRRAQRKNELLFACRHLGFTNHPIAEDGFSDVNLVTKKENSDKWHDYVQRIADILSLYKPKAIFFPHCDDQHPTHIGVHQLVMDALSTNPIDGNGTLTLFQTEFWHAMRDSNLMIESSQQQLAILIEAIACHKGEVQRNPYHLTQLAWMCDSVRRGSELIGGYGQQANRFRFATLYKRELWENGRIVPAKDGISICDINSSVSELLA